MIPRLAERLMDENTSNEESMAIADSVCLFLHLKIIGPVVTCGKIQKGVSSARSDDTKSLKGVVLDWITPRDAPLNPPLSRNVKTNRGYHHPTTGALLCPAGIDWKDKELKPRLFASRPILMIFHCF